jgi:hypothetical protein
MANQEFPLFALYHGATMLGNAMTPQLKRSEHGARGPSKSSPAKKNSRNLLDRLDAWLWRQRQSADEAYLAQSQDVFELERRIRALERSVGSRYY